MGCEEDGRGDFDGKIWTVCHGGILLDEDLAKYGTNFHQVLQDLLWHFEVFVLQADFDWWWYHHK